MYINYNRVNVLQNNPIRRKKFNLVLDIDNTLVSAIDQHFNYLINPKLRSSFNHIEMHDNIAGNYYIYERPNLYSFLSICSQFFNISIWTFATKEYAYFIAKNLFPPFIHIEHILSRDDTMNAKIHYPNKFKALEYLYNLDNNYNNTNTLIIDDNDDVKRSNMNNCIQIYPFDLLKNANENKLYDNELFHTFKKILKYFSISV
jgi:hypothetical protein